MGGGGDRKAWSVRRGNGKMSHQQAYKITLLWAYKKQAPGLQSGITVFASS